ncbi:methyl-CpG-binding domain-containing protein 5-like [Impatiens glandulifera]|uniref:methyl-CpG-binding domain-containing protein 5-like n=1 Tax=Impatiens glandulifera TaxID=253017 RepID=UPI001FB0C711|nr:methyl-CpG-binding domain-containing protein 5-like [Impatiens glandulifera]
MSSNKSQKGKKSTSNTKRSDEWSFHQMNVPDQYYIDPASNRRLRSKKEVQHYLETGMLKRPAGTAENFYIKQTPLSSSTKSQKGETSASSNTESSDGWSFDKVNVPDEIRWSLTDATNDKWCAISGNEIVSESTTLVWKAYYFLVANQ